MRNPCVTKLAVQSAGIDTFLTGDDNKVLAKVYQPLDAQILATAYNATYGAGIDPAGIGALISKVREVAELDTGEQPCIASECRDLLAALKLNKEEA